MNIIIDSQLIISRRTFNYKPGRQSYVQVTLSNLFSFFLFSLRFLWRGKAVNEEVKLLEMNMWRNKLQMVLKESIYVH